MEDNIDDLITDYLLGEMDAETRRHFEQRLVAEPELAARVALERDIAAALDNSSPENLLRANLNRISDSYSAPENLIPPPAASYKRKTFNLWIMGVLLLVLIILAFRQFLLMEENTPLPHPELPAKPAEQELQKQPEPQNPRPEKQALPMAAAFKPIPKLEDYIGSQRRSEGFHFILDTPKSSARFHLAAGQLPFKVSGKTKGQVPAGTAFNLLVFNNREKDFEAMHPVFSQTLNIQPDGTFLFKKKWSTSPGLYYLVVEEAQSGEWLLVDKFSIKDER